MWKPHVRNGHSRTLVPGPHAGHVAMPALHRCHPITYRSGRTMMLRTGLTVVLLAAAPTALSAQMTGFTPASAERQQLLEARFDALLEPDSLREWMRTLTAQPFYVGSPYNRRMAEWLRDRFRAWGFEAEIEEYRVLFPKPRIRELVL